MAQAEIQFESKEAKHPMTHHMQAGPDTVQSDFEQQPMPSRQTPEEYMRSEFFCYIKKGPDKAQLDSEHPMPSRQTLTECMSFLIFCYTRGSGKDIRILNTHAV
eukprot:1151158-Pelagomonas_calceolata.AAC.1